MKALLKLISMKGIFFRLTFQIYGTQEHCSEAKFSPFYAVTLQKWIHFGGGGV
jgi:hypothetical protein